MTARTNPRFRITTWPGSPIPLPDVRSGQYVIEEGVLLPVLPATEDVVPVQRRPTEPSSSVTCTPAGEIYLELLEVDLADQEAIFRFVNRFGMLGVADPFREWPFFEGLPYYDWMCRVLRKARKEARPIIAREGRAMAQFVAATLGMEPPGEEEELELEVETRLEFYFGATFIRDAARAWMELQGGGDPSTIRFESLLASEIDDDLEEGGDPLLTLTDFLRTLFDRGLEPFHPGVRVEAVDRGSSSAGTVSRLEVRPAPSAGNSFPLYAVCCAEIYNHIVEQATYRRCANEPCGRLFVRQQGRAEFGQHRTRGVMYCSATCARAQAQRALRRRRSRE